MPVKEMAFPFLLPGIFKRQPRYLVTGEISMAQSFPFPPRTFIADEQSAFEPWKLVLLVRQPPRCLVGIVRQ